MLRIAEQWHASDLGRQRQGNEDNFFVRSPLFVVADGMGGAQAGEVASEMAVHSFNSGLPDRGTPAEGLVRVIEDANREIHERSRSDHERAGMGTTVTAAYVGERDVTVAHVGDSRAYLLRDGDLIRLTKDHSLVEELVARGKLTEEQAEAHPQRSVITRALGPEPHVQVDVEVFPARGGDLFLLCSDGLTSMVHEPRLKAIVEEPAPLERIGRDLITAANEAGGRDNITVILFRLEDVTARDGAGAGATHADQDTREYDTFGGRAAADTREGVTQPQDFAADEMRAAAGEHEVEHRCGGTVALAAARPRADPEPTAEGPPPPSTRPRQPRRRRRVPVAWILGACILAGVLVAFFAATRQLYFVGADPRQGGAITIYRGLPYDGPFGLKLYSPVQGSGVTLEQVSATRRKTFTDHQLRSEKDARDLVLRLERGQLQ